jgi:hypothetical protein
MELQESMLIKFSKEVSDFIKSQNRLTEVLTKRTIYYSHTVYEEVSENVFKETLTERAIISLSKKMKEIIRKDESKFAELLENDLTEEERIFLGTI